MIELLLTKAGLAKHEVNAYLFLLHNGPHGASQIAEATGVKRSNMYHILGNLEEAGLVISEKRGSKTMFVTTHPKNVKLFLKNQKKDLDRISDQVGDIMPDLVSSYNLTIHKPGVYTFEGKDGVQKAFDELLEDRSTIYRIENTKQMWSLFPEYLRLFGDRRVKNKIDINILTAASRKERDTDIDRLRTVRYLDPEELAFTMDINVTKNKVVLTTFQKTSAVGIVIIHPEIVKNYQKMFDFFWKNAQQ